jgi:hypothetical protein
MADKQATKAKAVTDKAAGWDGAAPRGTPQ